MSNPERHQITLADLEIRYANIRKANPKIPNCQSSGCKNPIDYTEGMGWDTSCAYHRLLFDFWSCEVLEGDRPAYYFSHKKARRAAFTRWQHKIGKEECDKIVLRMAQESINWSC